VQNEIKHSKNIRHRQLLIHVALLHEAKPLIARLGLKQYETKPFKIFRSDSIVLIISGTGISNTQTALRWILQSESFNYALNFGTAACSDLSVKTGTVLWVSGIKNQTDISVSFSKKNFGLKLPDMQLTTESEPVTSFNTGTPVLADMEASSFFRQVMSKLPESNSGSVKVVSDHGSDKILSKQTVQSLVNISLDSWLPQMVLSVLPGFTLQTDTAGNELTPPVTPDKIWDNIRNGKTFLSLDKRDREAFIKITSKYKFSYSMIKQMADFAADFKTWQETSFADILRDFNTGKDLFNSVRKKWNTLKTEPKSYSDFKGKPSLVFSQKQIVHKPKEQLGFGSCPVASPKTRCCNLLTLDSVEGCAFDCSYCAIKTFYDPANIVLNSAFADKLQRLKIDPEKRYHIGTGQSSDSLLFGNKDGILKSLIDFAREHPNVILEFKTKSSNISYLLEQQLPPNILFTWSLNPPIIIKAEEHGTARLNQRLDAAKQMVKKGALVGFHFHPVIEYKNSQKDYSDLFTRVQNMFNPDDVALVSFGTLTFTKPVIKQLRNVPMHSKVLQMPLTDAGGKFSYPLSVKKRMFSHAYNSFKSWHGKVFFYLCMEDASLWPDVFSFSYPDNDTFETAMIDAYENKIRNHIKPDFKSLK
jgi:spore photoproduct lyase